MKFKEEKKILIDRMLGLEDKLGILKKDNNDLNMTKKAGKKKKYRQMV